MRRLDKMAATALAALLAGCFTVHRSDFPDVAMTRAPEGREVSVKLAGFEATVVSYLPVYGYETVWQERVYRDRHGRLRDGGVHPETYSTTSYIPQTHVTTAFIERAQDKLEDAGSSSGWPSRTTSSTCGSRDRCGARTIRSSNACGSSVRSFPPTTERRRGARGCGFRTQRRGAC